jgi:predicted nucleic-acid-binding protein
MIAIDTNVLVRVLVNDPKAEEQCRLARELMTVNGNAWVCRIVLVETVWVLQSAYQFTKAQILMVLEKLIQHPNLYLEDSDNLAGVLTVFSASNAGFADCLILNDAQHKQLILHTFDLKLSRLHGAKRVAVVKSDEAP